MDLALHFPVIKQGFRRGRSANLFMYELTEFRQIADAHSPRAFSGDRRAWPQEKAPRSKKGFVCCKKESDQSKMKQEEIISLFRRIQASISKGDSVGGIEEDKNRDGTTENVPLSKVILDILEKPRKNTEGNQP
ncbi:hypothetical protein AALP_AA7G010500 [Arabis alpina]|uniref:Uncharacterized protein n=1 Tax=Arabis alpina TaxID=50452 RepID=A0A087GF93_ARAAL|nr:hypothetical protein AALP_AA7G010500 [Arabis alpina]